MNRLPKPPPPSDAELNLPRLENHDGIRCLPDAPRWWEDEPEKQTSFIMEHYGNLVLDPPPTWVAFDMIRNEQVSTEESPQT